MLMEIRIEKFSPESASDPLWEPFLTHGDAIHEEAYPGDPLPPHEKRKSVLLSARAIKYITRSRFLLFPADSPGTVAGLAFLTRENPKSPSYESNKRNCNVNISVLPAYRRRGLGKLLLEKVIAEIAGTAPSVSELLFSASMPSGQAFLEKFGAGLSLETAENRLYLKDLDWKIVWDWAEEGKRRNPETEIIFTETIPESDLKKFSETYTETINHAPFGDISMKIKITPEMIREREKIQAGNGVSSITAYGREKDGYVSGITEISYMPELGHKINQLFTGVKESSRGRGLGKMLKAKMLLYVRERFPGVTLVVTGNADSNAPMLSINRRLGFKRHLPIKVYKLKLPVNLGG